MLLCLGLAPSQLNRNTWHDIISLQALWKVMNGEKGGLTNSGQIVLLLRVGQS